MVDISIQFLIVDKMFERYTIVVNAETKYTSVYCTECEQWVAEWDGDQLSRHSVTDLYERIVEEHKEQVLGVPVEFDETEKFI